MKGCQHTVDTQHWTKVMRLCFGALNKKTPEDGLLHPHNICSRTNTQTTLFQSIVPVHHLTAKESATDWPACVNCAMSSVKRKRLVNRCKVHRLCLKRLFVKLPSFGRGHVSVCRWWQALGRRSSRCPLSAAACERCFSNFCKTFSKRKTQIKMASVQHRSRVYPIFVFQNNWLWRCICVKTCFVPFRNDSFYLHSVNVLSDCFNCCRLSPNHPVQLRAAC